MLLLGVGGGGVAALYRPLGAQFLSNYGVGVNSAITGSDTHQVVMSYWENTTWTANQSGSTSGQQNWEYKTATGVGCEAAGQASAFGYCGSTDTATGHTENNVNDSTGTLGATHGSNMSIVKGLTLQGLWVTTLSPSTP